MELESLSVVAAPTAPVDTVNPIARLDTYVALLAGLIALGACGGDDDPVVARVGDAEIHASRLARFVERLPEGLRSQQQGLPAIREHLSSIVDQELLLAEVAARGIDDDIEVLRELNTRARSRLSQLYLTRQLMSSEDLPAEEVERVFRERGHDRQRLLARILVPSRAEARQVAARFDTDREAADSFGDVAERYSDNDPSAGEQGELAWIGIDDLGAFRIPEHEFFSLADGRVADEPVDLGGMWQVYSFRDSRKRGLSEVWEEETKERGGRGGTQAQPCPADEEASVGDAYGDDEAASEPDGETTERDRRIGPGGQILASLDIVPVFWRQVAFHEREVGSARRTPERRSHAVQKIQKNTPMRDPTSTQVPRNPSTVTALGFGISKSGCCTSTFRGAGSTPGGSVKGSVSGSSPWIGVRTHS